MKITNIKTYQVPRRYLFLKIETDEGVSGWGEPIVEGRAETVAAAVGEWKSLLIGADPLRIEDIWQNMYRGAFYRGGPVLMSAMAGIDQALWDIKGKVLGVPVYELLGGAVKDRIKVYRGSHGAGPKEAADDAELALKQGYKLIKTASAADGMHYVDSYEKIDEICERFQAVRDRVGYKVDLAVDFHGRVHRPMAKQLFRELQPFKLAFIEEPVLPTNNEALAVFKQYGSTPIATGERMYSRWDFKPLFESNCVDIVQPDLSHAGGISEVRRIAAMAEAYDVAVAPHCPLGVIAFAACIQLDAMTPNAVFQEQAVNICDCTRDNFQLHWIKNPEEAFRYEDGYVRPPKGPGLGIEVDEELVAEAAKEPHNWHNPFNRTFDGTPIEW